MLFRQHGRSLTVQTPAKLNLFLEILGKRSDGYHELETLMVSVGLYDSLSFSEEVSGRIRLRCFEAGSQSVSGDFGFADVPQGRANLIVQAAELLSEYAGVERGVRIDLVKRIPVAAGLAGGSSDAAATLMALNRFWDLKLSQPPLLELAAQIGSDVGFFLVGSPVAIGRGRGEIMEPLNVPLGYYFVIARPASGLSTAAVYQQCRPARVPKSVCHLAECLQQGRMGRAIQYMYNALGEPAEQLNGDVGRLKSKFSNQPVMGHMMSGSGTAYFGVCRGRRQAMVVASRLRATQEGCVFVAQCRP